MSHYNLIKFPFSLWLLARRISQEKRSATSKPKLKEKAMKKLGKSQVNS
jgi:hypothetical protein